MNKVLNRSLFTKPKQQHRSTGITSGLKYRQNYRVGGQVKQPKRGLVDGPGGYAGTDDSDLSESPLSPEVFSNPDLSSGKFQIGIEQANTLAKKLLKDQYTPDLDQYKINYNDPSLKVDYSKAKPTGLDTLSNTIYKTLKDQSQVVPGRTLGKPSTVSTLVNNFLETSLGNKKVRKELDLMAEKDATATALKNKEQDQKFGIAKEETLTKRSADELKLTTDLFQNSLQTGSLTNAENFLQLANNPKTDFVALTQGMDAFNIAGGYTAFRAKALQEFDENYKKRKVTVQRGGSSNSKKKDIIPIPGDGNYDSYVAERNNYIAERLNDVIGPSSAYKSVGIFFTPDLKLSSEVYSNELVPAFENMGLKENETLNNILKQTSVLGGEQRKAITDFLSLSESLKAGGSFNGIDGKLPTPRPILAADVVQLLDIYKQQGIDLRTEFNFLQPYLQGYNDGGRVGFSIGGSVATENNDSLTFEEMRASFSPQQINDVELKQMVRSEEMLEDFAHVRDPIDLNDFNNKYDTNISLMLG
tara:strand:+ start:183 stop:1772 length:1590 start_codon:yes stop_codon:yes gene_type:complete